MATANKIICSTGTVLGKNNGFDHTLLPALWPKIAADGLELILVSPWKEDFPRVSRSLLSYNLPFYSVHLDKDIGEAFSQGSEYLTRAAMAYFRENCVLAAGLGAKIAVLHLWGGLTSDAHIAYNFSLVPTLYKIAEGYGLLLTIENVVCAAAEPFRYVLALQKEFPFARFTLDTRFAAFHKQTAQFTHAANLWQAVAHVHISDYAGGLKEWPRLKGILHPGEGEVPYKDWAGAVARYRYTGAFTLESPVITDTLDIKKLNASLQKVRQMFSE